MKFGRRLLEALMEPGWETAYVEYLALKKLVAQAVRAGGPREERLLVGLFANRLAAGTRAAEEHARRELAAAAAAGRPVAAALRALPHSSCVGPERAEDVLEPFVTWSEHIQAIFRFCVTNRTAVRKIVKKLTKNLRYMAAKEVTAVIGPAADPDRLFATDTRRDLDDLLKLVKELECGVMVSCTDHVMRIRSIRADHQLDQERLKLRRVATFEADLARPLRRARHQVPPVHREHGPLRILAAAAAAPLLLSTAAIAADAGVLDRQLLQLRQLLHELLQEPLRAKGDLALDALRLAARPLFAAALCTVAMTIGLHHAIVTAKLRTMAAPARMRALHLASLASALLLVALAEAAGPDAYLACDGPFADAMSWLALAYVGIQTFLHIRLDLCSLATKASMLAALAFHLGGLGAACGVLPTPWSARRSELLVLHTVASRLAFAGCLASYAPMFSGTVVDLGVRARLRKRIT